MQKARSGKPGWFFAVCCLLLAAPAMAETWPVKEFEIFIGKPGGFFGDSEETPTLPMTVEQKAEIEAYLGHVADTLERAGFKAPEIEPVVRNARGESAFRVYYFDYNREDHGTDAPAARRSSSCGTVTPTIWLNGQKFLIDGVLEPKDYQDLAHEVFHGVQARYPLFIAHCAGDPGAWITEGTAQAVGADLAAYSIRRVDYPHRTEESWAAHRWGLRTYDRPIYIGTPNNASERSLAYAASSFWRYLGEHVARHGGADIEAYKPDYSYLIDFFNTVPESPISEGGSMFWLDQQLRNREGKFKLGLNQVYPEFITIFAAYGGTRVNPPSRTPAENRSAWLRNVFLTSKCPEIMLDIPKSLPIEPVAAECFRGSWPRSQPHDLQVRVQGQSKERLQALKLGALGGVIVADPILVQDGESWNATWIITIPTGIEPVELIFSNVASNPRYTRKFTGSIEFTVAAHRNNLVPQGPTPPARGSTPQPSPGTPSAIGSGRQAARVAEQIDEGMKELNPNMAHGGTVGRNPNARPCDNAFIDIACGPTTSISLEYVPGTFGSLMQSTGRGGAFGQFTSTMSGVAASDTFRNSAGLEAAVELYENTPGTHVTITIPLIDYGFTGTFNNASLVVNAGPKQTYKSAGPADIQPGPGYRFPFAGVVSIDEYSPWVLRGSYSGHLTNVDRLNLVGDDPSLPVHENIVGTFNIIAPWRKDSRMIVETAETALASVVADMQRATAGLDADDPGAMPGVQGGSASGGQQGGMLSTCDCSCNAKLELLPQCKAQCEPTLAACEGVKATAQSVLYVPPSIAAGEVTNEPFLRSMPDACEVLDVTAAISLLATAVEPSGPREWLPKVTSQCGYRPSSKAKAKAELNMMFLPLALVDSYTMSREELRAKAGGFNALMGATLIDVEGIGNIGFALIGEGAVTLKVYTGIYGTAMDSDELVTELVLTYTLTDSSQPVADLMKKLYDLSRVQFESLKQQAVTTHEGA